MTLESRLDDFARGWRGPLLAALVALIAGLPVVFGLPVLDRGEARTAQVTAQAMEARDLIDFSYQDEPTEQSPPAIHWLQAASVSVLSSAEARHIWVYRIPSLLGAMLASAACAWGAAAFFGPGTSAIAGMLLAASMLLSTRAGIADAGAVLCGAVTLAMAALGRLYRESLVDAVARKRLRLVFWLAVALAALDGGLAGTAPILLAGLALLAWDRRAPWARRLGWSWGLILLVAAVGAWVAAITVRTDGHLWATAAASLAPAGGLHLPPGLHVLTAPLLLFPAAALLPAALVGAWKARDEPGVRFALCWLVPGWAVLEFSPVKLLGEALPLYGALAWLTALAMTRPIGRTSQLAGGAISIAAGLVLAGGLIWVEVRYGDPPAGIATAVAVVLMLAAALAGAALVMAPDRYRSPALAAAAGLAILARGEAAASLLPRIHAIWLSQRVVESLNREGLNPRNGLIPGPVTVLGYDEPSLVFALGTETELGDVDAAAEAISEGRPVVVEQRQEAAFLKELADGGLKATRIWRMRRPGVDYSNGAADLLSVYRSDSPPPKDALAGAPDDEPATDKPAKDKP